MPIMIPAHAIHHDSRYFYDPELFNPDRFSSEEVKKRPHYSFLPFGKQSFFLFVFEPVVDDGMKYFILFFQVKVHAIASV